MDRFFRNPNEWYPLGASEDRPTPSGLGFFVQTHCAPLTSRHVSAVAAILARDLRHIEWKEEGKSIYLRRKSN